MNRPAALIAAATALAAAGLALAMAGPGTVLYRPGGVHPGHDRFAAACAACHEKWKGPTAESCAECHFELHSKDTHPAAKLARPVDAKVPQALSGATCVTCHREHRGPSRAGYTGPEGLCVMCHPAGTLNEGHAGFSAGSCRTPSCHSYHYNLSRDDYMNAPPARLFEKTLLPEKPATEPAERIGPEAIAAMRKSRFFADNPVIAAQYVVGPHYGTQATCAGCHGERGATRSPNVAVCQKCHEAQTKSYGAGRHGVNDALGLAPLGGEGRQVGCGACHDVHSLGMDEARREACLKCHQSRHTENYWKSGHWRYLSDPVFAFKPMRGADCAGCHMPRLRRAPGVTWHDVSHSTASKERMAVEVCANCHGLAFALRSLYDPKEAEFNFTFSSISTPPGLDYVYGAGGGRE